MLLRARCELKPGVFRLVLSATLVADLQSVLRTSARLLVVFKYFLPNTHEPSLLYRSTTHDYGIVR